MTPIGTNSAGMSRQPGSASMSGPTNPQPSPSFTAASMMSCIVPPVSTHQNGTGHSISAPSSSSLSASGYRR